jgi:hypothetical protein
LRRPNSRRWTSDELALLRRVAWSMSAAQIGILIGRTALAIRTKAAHERIRLKPDATGGAAPSAE